MLSLVTRESGTVAYLGVSRTKKLSRRFSVLKKKGGTESALVSGD